MATRPSTWRPRKAIRPHSCTGCRTAIRLRKLFKVFGRGRRVPRAVEVKVVSFVRRYRDDVILCVGNLARTVQPAELDLEGFAGLVPMEMLGYTEFPTIGTTLTF